MQNFRILAIDDNREILISLRIVLGKHFSDVKCHAEPCAEAEVAIGNGYYHAVLLDMNFSPGDTKGNEGLGFLERIKELDPTLSVVMMTAYGDIDLAVNAMKQGATDFIVKPWDNKKLVATITTACNLTQTKRQVNTLRDTQNVLAKVADQPFESIIGQSEAMASVYRAIRKVAATEANVLILGENGTGKELVARAIHRLSGRSQNLFVAVDMGSIAESLFESELFGHVKGAYTDARDDRAGRFEAAHGGTLFLDEITNIPVNMQAKLLGALQNRRVARVGTNREQEVDIRLLAATNANILELVENSLFRQDLYYRINTVEIHIPPLRERGDDVLLLANHFLDHYAHKYNRHGVEISKASQRLMKSYPWPGNVRELRHAIERAVIMCDGGTIEPENLVISPRSHRTIASRGSLNVEEVEKQLIIQSLKRSNGNMSQAAKELGLGRTTLYRKMQKYGL